MRMRDHEGAILAGIASIILGVAAVFALEWPLPSVALISLLLFVVFWGALDS